MIKGGFGTRVYLGQLVTLADGTTVWPLSDAWSKQGDYAYSATKADNGELVRVDLLNNCIIVDFFAEHDQEMDNNEHDFGEMYDEDYDKAEITDEMWEMRNSNPMQDDFSDDEPDACPGCGSVHCKCK